MHISYSSMSEALLHCIITCLLELYIMRKCGDGGTLRRVQLTASYYYYAPQLSFVATYERSLAYYPHLAVHCVLLKY